MLDCFELTPLLLVFEALLLDLALLFSDLHLILLTLLGTDQGTTGSTDKSSESWSTKAGTNKRAKAGTHRPSPDGSLPSSMRRTSTQQSNQGDNNRSMQRFFVCFVPYRHGISPSGLFCLDVAYILVSNSSLTEVLPH